MDYGENIFLHRALIIQGGLSNVGKGSDEKLRMGTDNSGSSAIIELSPVLDVINGLGRWQTYLSIFTLFQTPPAKPSVESRELVSCNMTTRL